MSPPILRHSVDANVPLDFAWRQRTDIRTWHDPPAEFRLSGAFKDGAVGETLMPGQPPLAWTVRDVRPQEGFTVEIALDEAVAAFEWRFEAVGEATTRMTQIVTLAGPNAAAYEEGLRAAFGATLEEGMARIARSLEAELEKTRG